MRRLIANHDLKSLACHAGAAAAAGLLLGAAMQPNLRADERPEGPQILAGVSGLRGDYAYDYGARLTAYGEKVPDYVIGADWLSPPRYEEAEADWAWFDEPPQEETVAFAEPEADEPIQVVRAWEPPPREPPHYPSTEGGVAYGADLPAPPSPLVEAAAGTMIEIVGG